jgi:hypothetical protein
MTPRNTYRFDVREESLEQVIREESVSTTVPTEVYDELRLFGSFDFRKELLDRIYEGEGECSWIIKVLIVE